MTLRLRIDGWSACKAKISCLSVQFHPACILPLNQSLSISGEDREEHYTKMPADLGITDFGLLPRERYPVVAVLTLAESEASDTYNIVSMTVLVILGTSSHGASFVGTN